MRRTELGMRPIMLLRMRICLRNFVYLHSMRNNRVPLVRKPQLLQQVFLLPHRPVRTLLRSNHVDSNLARNEHQHLESHGSGDCICSCLRCGSSPAVARRWTDTRFTAGLFDGLVRMWTASGRSHSWIRLGRQVCCHRSPPLVWAGSTGWRRRRDGPLDRSGA